MFSFLKSTKETYETDLSYNFDYTPQLPEEHQILQQIAALLTQVKLARDEYFASSKGFFNIVEVDRQENFTTLDVVILWLWGVSANYGGKIENAKIEFLAKDPYIRNGSDLKECHDLYKQFEVFLRRYFKVLLENLKYIKKNVQEYEIMKKSYMDLTDNAKSKVRDSNLGFLDRASVAAKTLANVGKLKLNSEALNKLEFKMIKEIYMAKAIIANGPKLLQLADDLGGKIAKDLNNGKTLPNYTKRYGANCIEVVKGKINYAADFVEKIFDNETKLNE